MQFSYGEFLWVFGSGVQLFVMLEVDFSDFVGLRYGNEFFFLIFQLDFTEELRLQSLILVCFVFLQLGYEVEGYLGDVFDGSDGVLLYVDGEEVEDQDQY